MALSLCRTSLITDANYLFKHASRLPVSSMSTVPEAALERMKKTRGERTPVKSPSSLPLRFMYQEFLPNPDPLLRNFMKEKLEHMDMLSRRSNIDIPEFYAGSVLAVKISDPHAQGKMNRFVGICIERRNAGLAADFTLRNVVDHQGVEVRYNLYDPTIQAIQVLRLEKRLDDTLYYLRDALPEYSTFSFDMEPEILPEGSEVPVNPLKVVMKKRPWDSKWYLEDIKGIKDFRYYVAKRHRDWIEKFGRRWEKYDLMKDYRETIPEEQQNAIWNDVQAKLQELDISRQKSSRKRSFSFPKKMG